MAETPDELRAALADGRAALKAAIEAATAAWETQPASGEGEAAWSPRQVAEHAIPVEAYYTTVICKVCGYPGVDRVTASYATAAEALAGLDAVVEMCNKKLKYVSETDLVKSDEKYGSCASLLKSNITHLNDHAAQIRAVAGG
ncbi:MAG: DinB family protein [Chloroflexi bacterium]|nr:DinB family protein [Chloroflexota bacterium]